MFILLMPAASLANDPATGPLAQHINHITQRGVSVINGGEGRTMIVLETDLSSDVKADLRVRLGKNGIPDPNADLGRIAKITGLQVFTAPPSIDVGQFDAVHIWDAGTGSSLGVAPF